MLKNCREVHLSTRIIRANRNACRPPKDGRSLRNASIGGQISNIWDDLKPILCGSLQIYMVSQGAGEEKSGGKYCSLTCKGEAGGRCQLGAWGQNRKRVKECSERKNNI